MPKNYGEFLNSAILGTKGKVLIEGALVTALIDYDDSLTREQAKSLVRDAADAGDIRVRTKEFGIIREYIPGSY